MNCRELLLVFPLFIKGIHVWRRGTNIAEESSVLHYWRSLAISERLLSLTLSTLNLAKPLCSAPLAVHILFPGCLPVFPPPVLTKPPPTPSPPSLPQRTRWTPLSLTASDKILKGRQKSPDDKEEKRHSDTFKWLLIFWCIRWLNTHFELSLLGNTHTLCWASFLQLLQLMDPNGEVRIKYWATDMRESYKIWIKSDINCIQFNTTDLLGGQEGSAGMPRWSLSPKIYEGNVYAVCVVQ